MHNPPIMAFSPSISDWEFDACASFNKGGIYCPMCATLCPKRQAVLGALAGDVAVYAAFVWAVIGAPAAVTAFPTAVAKKAGTVDGAPALVALHAHPLQNAARLGKRRHGMHHGLRGKLGCERMEAWCTPDVRHRF
jgi:hypothetical protein